MASSTNAVELARVLSDASWALRCGPLYTDAERLALLLKATGLAAEEIKRLEAAIARPRKSRKRGK